MIDVLTSLAVLHVQKFMEFQGNTMQPAYSNPVCAGYAFLLKNIAYRSGHRLIAQKTSRRLKRYDM
jgi:hypothetical protein